MAGRRVRLYMPKTDCSHQTSVVLESRSAGNNQVRRRRQCKACGFKFTTYEITENDYEDLRWRAAQYK